MANGNGENGNKFLTWKALASILVSLLILVGSYTLGTLFSEAKADIKSLQERKVDKDQYQRDIGDMKNKIDKIYQWHLPKDLRDKE